MRIKETCSELWGTGESRLLPRQHQPRRASDLAAVRDECCVGGASRLEASTLPAPQDLDRPGRRWCSIRFAARSSPRPSASAAGLSPHAPSPPCALFCQSARRMTEPRPYRPASRDVVTVVRLGRLTPRAPLASTQSVVALDPGPLPPDAAGDELLHQIGAYLVPRGPHAA